jgi:hypothetical protein
MPDGDRKIDIRHVPFSAAMSLPHPAGATPQRWMELRLCDDY